VRDQPQGGRRIGREQRLRRQARIAAGDDFRVQRFTDFRLRSVRMAKGKGKISAQNAELVSRFAIIET